VKQVSKTITTIILVIILLYTLIFISGFHRNIYDYFANMPARGADVSYLNLLGISVILLCSAVFSALSYAMAKKKKRNPIGWAALGILLNVWSLIILYNLPSKANQKGS